MKLRSRSRRSNPQGVKKCIMGSRLACCGAISEFGVQRDSGHI